jgi:putative ABC transport system ATP-binding protein
MEKNKINLNEHFDLLLDKYDLKDDYYKFLLVNGASRLLKEGFYWGLLYLSNILKDNPDKILNYSVFLIGLWGAHVPSERFTNHLKSNFIEKIKSANTKYFNDKITNLTKEQTLMFDLVEYYTMLDHLNDGFEGYVNNIKSKQDIPFRCILIFIIAYTKSFMSIIGIFTMYYFIVWSLNEHKFIKESELTKQYIEYDGIIRNYLVNSKNFLINDEFNKEYLNDKVDKFRDISNQILKLNDDLDMNVNFVMFGMIILVIWMKFNKLSQYDFLYYFFIIDDIEFIGDKIMEYYRNKSGFNRMQVRLDYLNSYKTQEPTMLRQEKINKIIISNLSNSKPFIKLTNPLEINSSDHILLEGESGSGKTTLFYILKGIVKPEQLDISPDIKIISPNTYLTLPNHKSLYSGKLYDIITNYSINPDVKLINFALESAKINDKLITDDYVNVEKLSSGERIRLLIARIIYTVKNKNYDILLFDEIDENLNDDLAIEIWNNLSSILNDKMIIYITHNEQVKKLFSKKLSVKNGIMTFNQ